MGSIIHPAEKVALEAVALASQLSARLQGRIGNFVEFKSDASPVTLADLAVQTVTLKVLMSRLGPIRFVGEEDAIQVRADRDLAEAVASAVSECLRTDLSVTEVVEVLSRPQYLEVESTDHDYWILDPIDGTKGYLRGDQFAIALALVRGGSVEFGVLGCPQLRSLVRGERGVVYAANRSAGSVCYSAQEILSEGVEAASSVPISVSNRSQLDELRVAESYEPSHARHDRSAILADHLGLRNPPLRMDGQGKYAAVAEAQADLYMRFCRGEKTHEKLWDHAAGTIVVEQAGGRVTDLFGQPLEIRGTSEITFQGGVLVTNGIVHDEIVNQLSELGLSAP